MAADYTQLAILKLALGITNADADTLLKSAITAASREIDKKTGRRFYLDDTATARVYSPFGRVVNAGDGQRLLIDDIGSLDDLVVETGRGSSWSAVTNYETSPDNALADGLPITALLLVAGTWGYGTSTRVRVTARWGWPTVPDEIAQAALLQAARLYRRKDSPEGVSGSSDWGLIRVPNLDPDVRALIEPYTLPGFG